MTQQQKEQFIRQGRQVATAILLFEEVNEFSASTDALNQMSDEDFTGENAGITKADFFALLGVPWADVSALLAKAGVKTVLYKLIEA